MAGKKKKCFASLAAHSQNSSVELLKAGTGPTSASGTAFSVSSFPRDQELILAVLLSAFMEENPKFLQSPGSAGFYPAFPATLQTGIRGMLFPWVWHISVPAGHQTSPVWEGEIIQSFDYLGNLWCRQDSGEVTDLGSVPKTWMWHLGMRFSGGPGSAGLGAGLSEGFSHLRDPGMVQDTPIILTIFCCSQLTSSGTCCKKLRAALLQEKNIAGKSIFLNGMLKFLCRKL